MSASSMEIAHGSAARRIYAMVLRYFLLMKGSLPRILELAYWPTLQIVLWGLITLHLQQNSSWVAQAAGVLIASVILWDVLTRAQLGVSISFLEEMWSRNLGNLFVSPLRPAEMVVSLMVIAFVRTVIGMLPAAAIAIPLFSYSIFTMGLPLVAFFANLMVLGWAFGLIAVAIVLRYGLGAEGLVWVMVFAIAPVSAVYYPVDVLPNWIRWLAWTMPPAYVFEGMRTVLFEGRFRYDLFFGAVALNVVYLALAGVMFLRSFTSARKHGRLFQIGE